eukprot:jgi/Bigna1/70328/fgenesh1_pg.11_\
MIYIFTQISFSLAFSDAICFSRLCPDLKTRPCAQNITCTKLSACNLADPYRTAASIPIVFIAAGHYVPAQLQHPSLLGEAWPLARTPSSCWHIELVGVDVPDGALRIEWHVKKVPPKFRHVHWDEKDSILKVFPRCMAINIERFSLETPYKDKLLIHESKLAIEPRRRIALFGENGAGKSTLFNAMQEKTIENFPEHVHVYHAKEIDIPPGTKSPSVLKTVLGAHKLRNTLLFIESQLESLAESNDETEEKKAKYAENLEWIRKELKRISSDTAESRAKSMLRVLGFDDKAQDKPLTSLSGCFLTSCSVPNIHNDDDAAAAADADDDDDGGGDGDGDDHEDGGLRMRVALCAAFFLKADLLLLDEPTNHLDFPTILWLEHKLRSYDGAFILVTHDKHLLENVCQGVIVLEEKHLKYYMCPYKQFVKRKAAEDKKRYEENHKFLERHQSDSSLGVSGNSRKLQDKEDWCREYVNRQVRIGSKFTFPDPRPLPGHANKSEPIPLQKLTDCRFAYDGKKNFIFDDPFNVTVWSNTRLGVMGPNGAGKSTLLKLLNERISPTEGEYWKHNDFDISYFGQHSAEELNLDQTPIEWMMTQFPEEKEAVLRNHMKRVGCTGDKQDSRMKGFSGGQKACVIFSKLTYRCPHLLVLDEPTNFLATVYSYHYYHYYFYYFSWRDMLMHHSRYFLEKCCNQFLSITPGKFSYHNTLKQCEKDTYDFIARLEAGKNVRIKKVGTGAGQLAEQKELAEAEEAAAAAANTTDTPKGGMQVQMDFDVNELLEAPKLEINMTKAEKALEKANLEMAGLDIKGGKDKKKATKKKGK